MTLDYQHNISEVILHFILQLSMVKLILSNVDSEAEVKMQSKAMHVSCKTKNVEIKNGAYQYIVQS